MDEVDKIILVSLKDVGIRMKPGCENLKSYSFEEIVKMIVSCLEIICQDVKFAEFPPSLPGTMSARYQMSSRLAQLTTELGYKGDVGYQTFMYQNTDGIRRVLEFLVERLPKKNAFHVSDDTRVGIPVSVKQQISQKLKKMLTSSINEHPGMCVSPFISLRLETGTVLPNQKLDCQPIEWKNFVVNKLPVIDEQLPDNRFLLPSLISLNLNGVMNPNKPKITQFEAHSRNTNDLSSSVSIKHNSISISELNVPSENKILVDDTERKKLKSVTMTEEQLIKKTEDEEVIKELENKIGDYKSQVSNLSSELESLKTKNENVRQTLRRNLAVQNSFEQSLQLLPDAENNTAKLKAVNEKSVAKLQKMENQWTQHKKLLEEKRLSLKKEYDMAVRSKNELLNRIAEKRKELFETVEQISQRMMIDKRLQEHVDSAKGVNRNEYVSRILDIINSLKKQDAHIQEILKDLRSVQKEMNLLTEKLGRSFKMAEQLITVNSPTDEFSKETHRLLITIHKDMSETVTMTKEIGDYGREIKDLEDQLADCSKSFAPDALNEVTMDLQRLQNENERLMNEVKRLENVDVNAVDSSLQNNLSYTKLENGTSRANNNVVVSNHTRSKPIPVHDHPLAETS